MFYYECKNEIVVHSNANDKTPQRYNVYPAAQGRGHGKLFNSGSQLGKILYYGFPDLKILTCNHRFSSRLGSTHRLSMAPFDPPWNSTQIWWFLIFFDLLLRNMWKPLIRFWDRSLKGNFLLLRPEAPASAALPIDSSTPSVETQIQQLTGTLKYTAGIFDFPQKADCRRRRVVVMPSDEPGIIAEWHFTCGRPQYLDSVSTRLFALMHLHSIQAVILPHGQWTLRPDEPLLQLQKR